MQELLFTTIQGCSLFQHLDAATIDGLVAQATLSALPEGHMIVREGEPVSHLFLVAQGVVRVSTHSLNREVELKHLGPGSYFGEVSLLSGKSATATVEARQGEVQLVAIARDAILALVQADEQVRRMLEGVTLARAKDTIAKVLQ